MLLKIFYKIIEQYSLQIFFINSFIILFLISLFVISKKRKKQKIDKISKEIEYITKTTNSIRYGILTNKITSLDLPNSENLIDSINRMIDSLHDREAMIAEYKNELHKQNKLLTTVIDSLSDGLIIINKNKEIEYATTNIVTWFQKDKEKLIGQNLSDYIEVPGKKPIQVLKNENVNIKSTNSSNYIATTVEVNLNEEYKYIVILRNITEQVELEKLKEDFVATLTHDLKVPIIAETNMLNLFLNEAFGELNDKQKTALKNMQVSNQDLLELVQTVLDTYRVKDGKLKLYKENILLKSFITQIIEEMKPIVSKNENEINFVLERDIRIFADNCQLKRVIKNLIQNAVSYGYPKTPITITIGEIPDYVVIKIRDTGAGISQENIEKIFNRYYSAAQKFHKIGTGLGLYLSCQIIKAHNGDLTVESKLGEFTEFCIKIPVNNYEHHFL